MAKSAEDEQSQGLLDEDDPSQQGCLLGRPWFIYLQAYFLTIASVLGTGILGLPVTLSKSGFSPFFFTFAIGCVIQVFIVYFFTDLLQKTSAYLRHQLAAQIESNDLPLKPLDDHNKRSSDEEEEEEELQTKEEPLVVFPKGMSFRNIRNSGMLQPNLHNMGQLFLGKWSRRSFDVLILVMFLSFITSYALAGSQAFQQLFRIKSLQSVIPFFVGINVAAILLAQVIVKPLVSALTFFKGLLLSVTVVVAFVVGSKVHSNQSTDFSAAGDTFLMGTVAMGGAMNIMPLMYARVQLKKNMVTNFRRAVLLGLFTCAVLNVLWCFAVLSIVPQQCALCPSKRPFWMTVNTTKHCCLASTAAEVPDGCILCLQQADNHGRISTVPLINVVEGHYPRFKWMAILVELFIVVSITVSFLVYGSSLKQTWDGLASTVMDQSGRRGYGCISPHRIFRWIAYLFSFGGVFLIAMHNPEGFIYILDRAGSFCINLEIVVFLVPMVRKSWQGQFRCLRIALPLSSWFYWLYIPVLFYSLFAVTYDAAELISDHLFS